MIKEMFDNVIHQIRGLINDQIRKVEEKEGKAPTVGALMSRTYVGTANSALGYCSGWWIFKLSVSIPDTQVRASRQHRYIQICRNKTVSLSFSTDQTAP